MDEGVAEGPLAVSMAKAYVSDAYRRVARRRHPAPRRHRLHLGARPAPLLQARQGLGVHLRRRHVSSRAGRPARRTSSRCVASPARMIERVREQVGRVDSAGSVGPPAAGQRSSSPTTKRSRTSRARWRAPRSRSTARSSRCGAGRATSAGASRTRAERSTRADDLRSLGETVGGLAHNFNNSLAAILAYTELMLREAPTEAAQRRLSVIARRRPRGVGHRAPAAGVRLPPAPGRLRAGGPARGDRGGARADGAALARRGASAAASSSRSPRTWRRCRPSRAMPSSCATPSCA